MPITVNEGGVLYELETVSSNEGGVLYELDTVNSNEGGVLKEIFSAWAPPTSVKITQVRGFYHAASQTDISTVSIDTTGKSFLPYMYIRYAPDGYSSDDTVELSFTTTAPTKVTIVLNGNMTSSSKIYTADTVTGGQNVELPSPYIYSRVFFNKGATTILISGTEKFTDTITFWKTSYILFEKG